MKRLNPAIFLTICILCLNFSLMAKDYTLKLKSGDLEIPSLNPSTSLKSIENVLENNFVIVQFSQIPTESEKSILNANGLKLLEYIPEYAFIAELKNSSATSFGNLNIRGIIPFETKFKLSRAVAALEIPTWASNNNSIDLIVEPHLNVSAESLESFLRKNNIDILSREPSGVYVEIRIKEEFLTQLTNTPIIKAIDFIPAPPEKEDQEARSMHRGNMLDSDHPLGRQYDGTGVSIAIADDAIIGPHIDIKGRVTSFANDPNGTHGDMTTGIVMGAGNLNPNYRGMAVGAYLYYYDIGGYPHISQAVSNLNNRGVVITSTSFSEGCNAGYTATTRTVDQQIRQNPELLHVFSAGNSSGSTCGSNAYGAGTPWGTITGGRKQGKSAIATGNLTYAETLVASSSRGPAKDGRIKPDICANGGSQMSTNANNTYQVGGGTSAAAPGIAGLAAQMYHGYRSLNSGNDPESALIKSAMLNTARDLGNPGPDFTYGWGRVNAHRAMKLIEDSRYLSSTISQNGANNHSVTIASNVEELKFMLYWTDFEGSTSASKALVNDLEFRVVTPMGDTILPWVLDHTPNSINLTRNATRGTDNLNNMEQVSIDTVNAGTYTLLVDGKTVPQGPQKYYIVWEARTNDIEVTYPHGGESFTPGTTETIRWDAVSTSSSISVQYSTDSMQTWNFVTVTNGLARHRDWIIPNSVSGNVFIRVNQGSNSGVSANSASIIGVPTNIRTNYICPDSIGLQWNAVPGATGYEVSMLGATHMDSIGTTSTNSFVIRNFNLRDDNWVSVKALGNGIIGKRANAIILSKAVTNCPLSYDVELLQITSPTNSYLLSCGVVKRPVRISINNNGDSTLVNIPLLLSDGMTNFLDTIPGPIVAGASLNYTFNDSLSLSTGNPITISVVNLLSTDVNSLNDTLTKEMTLTNLKFNLPYTNNFENFTTCRTNFDCGNTICNLNEGWYNVENGNGDVHDLRVDAGGTPSNGTGPSVDHNPGTSAGKYLYSEASNSCTNVASQTISPCFDLTNTIRPEFSFWYHMNGTAVGSIRVDVFSNGAWVNNLTTITGSQGSNWLQRTINMSTYSGQVVKLRFVVTTGSGFSSDIAIDDISFIDVSVGLENIEDSKTFNVYPNPSEGIFTLQFTELPKNNVQIIDMNGRIIEEMNIKSTVSQIDLSAYAKGIYFLSIKNTAIREKLIVY